MNNVPIPNHWSPHQALAVLDFLEALHHAIWEAYQEPLVDLLVNQTTDDPLTTLLSTTISPMTSLFKQPDHLDNPSLSTHILPSSTNLPPEQTMWEVTL